MLGKPLLVGEASPYMGPELYVCFSRAAYGDGVSLAGQADTCLALGAFQQLAVYVFVDIGEKRVATCWLLCRITLRATTTAALQEM